MKKFYIFLIGLFLSAGLYAQSADVVTEILNTNEVTYGQICYLSACAQGLVNDDASYETAIQVLFDKGQIPAVEYAATVIPVSNVAYLFAQLWKVKGGVMYRLTKGSPRYAFKQFKSDGLIDSKIDPKNSLTGWEALNILTNCSFKYGNMEVSAADSEEKVEE